MRRNRARIGLGCAPNPAFGDLPCFPSDAVRISFPLQNAARTLRLPGHSVRITQLAPDLGARFEKLEGLFHLGETFSCQPFLLVRKAEEAVR